MTAHAAHDEVRGHYRKLPASWMHDIATNRMLSVAPMLRALLLPFLFALLHVVEAHAAETDCSPRGVDVCERAKAQADAGRDSWVFNSTEASLTAGRPAFESPSSRGREYLLNIIMPFDSKVLSNINEDQRFAKAVVASDMHRLARRIFCSSQKDFIEHGGIVHPTYFFRDRIKITDVVITDCSVGAVTWDTASADPCAPYGYDICALLSNFVEGQNALIAKDEAAGKKSKSHHEFSAFRLDHGTLVIDLRDHHTLAEQQADRSSPQPDTAYLEQTRILATHLACSDPIYNFVVYGGTVIARFSSADGHLVSEQKISFCEKDPER